MPQGECCLKKRSTQNVSRECRMKKKSTILGWAVPTEIEKHLSEWISTHSCGGQAEGGVYSTVQNLGAPNGGGGGMEFRNTYRSSNPDTGEWVAPIHDKEHQKRRIREHNESIEDGSCLKSTTRGLTCTHSRWVVLQGVVWNSPPRCDWWVQWLSKVEFII